MDTLRIKVLGYEYQYSQSQRKCWQYLPYYIARLKIAKCLEVLLHCSVEIALGVKMIAIASVYICKGCFIQSLRLGHGDGREKEASSKEYVELGRRGSFI